MEISVQGPVVPGDTETFALENIEIDMVDGAPFGDVPPATTYPRGFDKPGNYQPSRLHHRRIA